MVVCACSIVVGVDIWGRESVSSVELFCVTLGVLSVCGGGWFVA